MRNKKTTIITDDANKYIVNLYSDFDTSTIESYSFNEIDNIDFSKTDTVFWVSYWFTEFYSKTAYYDKSIMVKDIDSTLHYKYMLESYKLIRQKKPMIYYNNIEQYIGNWSVNKKNETEKLSKSPNKSYLVLPNGFSTTLEIYPDFNTLNKFNKIIRASVYYVSKDSINAELVIALEKEGETLYWTSVSLKTNYHRNKTWNKSVKEIKLPDEKDYSIKIYVWNTSNDSLYLDNFKVVIF